jgi:hypothetical protein
MINFKQFINEQYTKSDAIGYNVGKFIYHVTPLKNLNNIKINGFIPQDGESINGEEFEHRTYFATSLIAAYDISINFGSYKDDDEYIIFKLDSNCLTEYEKDPLFAHGIYVDYIIGSRYIVEIFDADDLFDKFDDDDLDKLY